MIVLLWFAKRCEREPHTLKQQRGFSLIEMAIVLVILGLLLAGVIMPLSSQREVSQRQATERQLQEIRNALIGFAQANNRLPCPALATGNGIEARNPAGVCTAPNGFVPFQNLGLQGTLFNGNLVDAWQQPYKYRLTNPAGSWIYAQTLIPIPAQAPNFQVCNTLPCGATQLIATGVVAVVFSTGRDGADIPASTSPDQVANLNAGNLNFVMRPITGNARTGTEFDDILVWISRPMLVYELSRAGQ